MKALYLAPKPRQWIQHVGHFNPQSPLDIHLAHHSLYDLALQARDVFRQNGLETGALHAENQRPESGLLLYLNPYLPRPEAYRLEIRTDGIDIEGQNLAGIFYALKTLEQILSQDLNPGCLDILDWPDFPHRGIMLDISRDKVPTMSELYQLVELMSRLKYNQLQLYTEHTFAYRGHESVWKKASPMTPEEILSLDAFCQKHFIELVPNQNSFGHMARWLKHPAYTPLAETGPEGFEHPLTGKHVKAPFSLCPEDEGSLYLLDDLYAQLLPHFSSQQFNIGCDETFDLGQGRSKEACRVHGKGQVYLDFLKQIHGLVKRHGHTLQFWGDIILNHPQLIPQLPKPCIALNWGYEGDHPFMEEGEQFKKAGVPYYVCPGTSSWNSLGGRTKNMLANLKHAAEAAQKQNAIGFLLTDWGDNGHWQTWCISQPGYLLGAAYAWCQSSNQDLGKESELAICLDQHVFNAPQSGLGKLLLEMGKIHDLSGIYIKNQSVLFHFLYDLDEIPGTGKTNGLCVSHFDLMQGRLLELAEDLTRMKAASPQEQDLMQECQLSLRFMQQALSLGRARFEHQTSPENLPPELRLDLAKSLRELLKDYPVIWSKRNRPGGLSDSLQYLEKLLDRYQS